MIPKHFRYAFTFYTLNTLTYFQIYLYLSLIAKTNNGYILQTYTGKQLWIYKPVYRPQNNLIIIDNVLDNKYRTTLSKHTPSPQNFCFTQQPQCRHILFYLPKSFKTIYIDIREGRGIHNYVHCETPQKNLIKVLKRTATYIVPAAGQTKRTLISSNIPGRAKCAKCDKT